MIPDDESLLENGIVDSMGVLELIIIVKDRLDSASPTRM